MTNLTRDELQEQGKNPSLEELQVLNKDLKENIRSSWPRFWWNLGLAGVIGLQTVPYEFVVNVSSFVTVAYLVIVDAGFAIMVAAAMMDKTGSVVTAFGRPTNINIKYLYWFEVVVLLEAAGLGMYFTAFLLLLRFPLVALLEIGTKTELEILVGKVRNNLPIRNLKNEFEF